LERKVGSSHFAPENLNSIRYIGLGAVTLGGFLISYAVASQSEGTETKYGSSAALHFAANYRGDTYSPGVLNCYPDAKGIPFADCENIIPMSANLWTPKQITADFQRRMQELPENERKRGIIVLLKTERCATKEMRGCTVTTAALEKRSTALAGDFLIYGVLLKPRDHDRPPGSEKVETGLDAWKNEAAGEYLFHQGPGATLAFINPSSGRVIDHTDAARLSLTEKDFRGHQGETPLLHLRLQEVLQRLP
jgi:hypothetical protein